MGSVTGCHISLFYIKPQLNVYQSDRVVSCHISLFYIKPQRDAKKKISCVCCHISLFYIKPQLATFALMPTVCCHISLFYIKPQLLGAVRSAVDSCHISLFYIKPQLFYVNNDSVDVVIYRYSTSNHNSVRMSIIAVMLSYIVILHQTTTRREGMCDILSCHISLFYIKPQRVPTSYAWNAVVIYRYSTSNHNIYYL